MKNEIKPLTGVRGVAACAVMLYHISHIPPFHSFNFFFVSKGYLCVDLFFVLSGFVMALVYSKTFQNNWTRRDYRNFLFNRIARVFPLHLIMVLFFGLRVLGMSSPIDFLSNIFMLQGWGFGAKSIVGNSWSVSTEIFAYLVFPFLIAFAFSRFFAVQVLSSVVLLLCIAASSLGAKGPLDLTMTDNVLPLIRCVAGFSLGLIAYRFSHNQFAIRWFSNNISVLGSMLLVIGLMIIPKSDVAVVISFSLLILSLYYNSRVASIVFGNRIVHHLGVVSYSLYLWHPFFRDLAGRASLIAENHGITGFNWLFALGAIVFSWLASWLSYVSIEVPGRRALNWYKAQINDPAHQWIPRFAGRKTD